MTDDDRSEQLSGTAGALARMARGYAANDEAVEKTEPKSRKEARHTRLDLQRRDQDDG